MDFIQDITINGGEVYIVGGTNRDKMFNMIHGCNISSCDVDLLVGRMDIDVLVTILTKHGNVKEVGKSFGVILFKDGNCEYDLAIPRKEVSTGPGYRDFNIVFDKDIPVEMDLERRDATMNAIAVRVRCVPDIMDPMDPMNLIVDPFDGIGDIRNKLWRAVGEPFKRFVEDPTRIMRALRQCAQFDLNIEDGTMNAILTHADLIKVMIGNSSVRLIEELVRLLAASYPMRWIDFIVNRSSIGKLLELNSCNDISEVINRTVELDLPIEDRMFALLFRCVDDYDQMEKWIKKFNLSAALHFPSSMIKFILMARKHYDIIPTINTDSDMRRFIVKMQGTTFSNKIIKLYRAINNANISDLNTLSHNNENTIISIDELAINGNELMEIYNITGKQIGTLKRNIFECILNGNIVNEKNAIINYINSSKLL